MVSWASDYERAQAVVVGQILTQQTVAPHLREEVPPETMRHDGWRAAYEALLCVFDATGEVAYPDAMKALSDAGIGGVDWLERIHAAEEESYGLRHTLWPVRRIRVEAERLGLVEVIGTASERLAAGQDSRDVAVDLQRGLSRVVQDSGTVHQAQEAADLAFAAIEARASGSGADGEIATGFPSIDSELRGLSLGTLTLISGPTGNGKTSLAVNWMHEICLTRGESGLFVSLEMSARDMIDRFVARASGHTLNTIWDGTLDGSVKAAISKLNESGLAVTDNSPRTITQILALIERESVSRGIKVFCVDYVGEIVEDRRKKEDERNDQMYRRWIKLLRQACVAYGIHGLVLCQNNKEGDLAESKAMSHVADTWLHFWRDATGGHRLMVRKARKGPVGQTYRIHFDPARQVMRELGRETSAE